jgi:hypothetical protein
MCFLENKMHDSMCYVSPNVAHILFLYNMLW